MRCSTTYIHTPQNQATTTTTTHAIYIKVPVEQISTPGIASSFDTGITGKATSVVYGPGHCVPAACNAGPGG